MFLSFTGHTGGKNKLSDFDLHVLSLSFDSACVRSLNIHSNGSQHPRKTMEPGKV